MVHPFYFAKTGDSNLKFRVWLSNLLLHFPFFHFQFVPADCRFFDQGQSVALHSKPSDSESEHVGLEETGDGSEVNPKVWTD